MSTQIVQLPDPADGEAGPVGRLSRAVQQPTLAARQVQQLVFFTGQVQFQGRFLQQHVQAGTATTDMVGSLRCSIARIEQRLGQLVDALGAQHVELDELCEDLTALVDAVLDPREVESGHGSAVGNAWVAGPVRSGKTRHGWGSAASMGVSA